MLLVALLISVALSGRLVVNTDVLQKYGSGRGITRWSGGTSDKLFTSTQSTCTFYIKHGTNPYHAKTDGFSGYEYWYGNSRRKDTFYIPEEVRPHTSTYIFMPSVVHGDAYKCFDALLVDYFEVYDDEGGVQRYGTPENGKGFCMSDDPWDAHDWIFNHWNHARFIPVPAWGCFTMFELRPANTQVGGASYPWDVVFHPWAGAFPWGTEQDEHHSVFHWWETRRLLMEEQGVPSNQDVIDCQEDESREEKECEELADKIITFHIENDKWAPLDERFPPNVMPENDDASSSTETETEDRRVLSALRRVMKA